MRVSRGSRKEYELGAETKGDYVIYGLIKHDKSDVSFPLLETAPVYEVEHAGDTGFTTVIIIFK